MSLGCHIIGHEVQKIEPPDIGHAKLGPFIDSQDKKAGSVGAVALREVLLSLRERARLVYFVA
jgi:hypothetical protein